MPHHDQHIEDRIDELVAGMTLEEKARELGNDAPANHRLGLPQLNHGEILHGVMVRSNDLYGAAPAGVTPTVFPQTIAMGCTFDPDLIERLGHAIAREARSLRRHHCYSPNLDIACDPRFGRVEENFGEDPHLVTRLGVAIIHGFQGRGSERFDERHVLATAKHFAGYGLVRGGINGAEVDCGERALREVHLPPFEAAVREAGVACIMPSHHAQDGVACHANRWLLRQILRQEWGFDGVTISDNVDIYRLFSMQRIANDEREAAILALAAGMDMEIQLRRDERFMCFPLLPDLVRRGRVDEDLFDQAVRRALRLKLQLAGAGEDPVDDPHGVCNSDEHRDLAREAACQSHVLLANDGILPLSDAATQRIALIGPHADRCEYGGYVGDIVAPGVTPLAGLGAQLGADAEIAHAHGCGFGIERDGERDDADDDATIAEAVALAAASEIVVLTLGDCRAVCGEGADNADISLPGRQHELAHAVLDCGKPTVLVLIGGRPWAVADIAERCQAVLLAWYGGCEAGTAIAESLTGANNPGGKLSMSFPRSIGHTQCSYLRRPAFNGSGFGAYRQHQNTPLFPFGHGLSYTNFSYDDLRLSAERIGPAGRITATVTLTNTGERAGDEVVQCYLRDEVASITPFERMLTGFQRVHLAPGEARTLAFDLGSSELALWDRHMHRVVEPGWFTLRIGGSSDAGLEARFLVQDPDRDGIPAAPSTPIAIRREDDMETVP